MSNPIKYSTGTESLALKKGNFYIGTGDVGKGPTSTTGYYNGITPPSGGYTIYLNKETGGPSIYTASNDSELIGLTNAIAGQSYTTANECLVYFAGQTDKMVLNRNYEGIVTDGLVLNLDAGFTPSYPKSGTTLYDVGLSGNTSSLINGVNFSSDNSGILSLDGSNDYVDIPYQTYLDLPTARTTSFWVKLNSNTTFQTMLGQAQPGQNRRKWDVRYGGNSSTDQIIRVVLGTGVGQQNCNTSTTYNLTTQWYNISVTYNGSITTCSIYINGSLAGRITNAFSSLYSSVDNSDNTLGFNIGRRQDNSNYTNGNVSNLLIYNRDLSDSEVLQNFNAQKGRFGL
jgi:hypothetical protein